MKLYFLLQKTNLLRQENLIKNLIISIKKDLKFPYSFKKSIYADDNLIRDYVFKGYTITYKIDIEGDLVLIIGIIKSKNNY